MLHGIRQCSHFDTGASRAFPAGDVFLVYPGDDGTPRSSIRGEVLREAMEDMRILDLVEEKLGRDRALKIIHEDFPGDMNFEKYPLDPEYYVRLREKAAGGIGVLNYNGTYPFAVSHRYTPKSWAAWYISRLIMGARWVPRSSPYQMKSR